MYGEPISNIYWDHKDHNFSDSYLTFMIQPHDVEHRDYLIACFAHEEIVCVSGWENNQLRVEAHSIEDLFYLGEITNDDEIQMLEGIHI